MLVNITVFLFSISVLVFSYDEGKTIYSKVLGLLLILIFLYGQIKNNYKFQVTTPYKIIFLWLIWGAFSSLVNGGSIESLNRLFTLFQLVFMCIALVNLQVRQGNANALWYGFVVSSIIISILVIYNPGKYATSDGRVFGTMSNSNMFGVALIVSLMVVVRIIYELKYKILLPLGIAVYAFIFYMLIETGSRKGMFCGVLFPGFLFMYLGLSNPNFGGAIKSMIVILAISFLFGTAFFVSQSSHFKRIQRVVNAVESGNKNQAGASEIGRLHLYEVGINATLNNPVFGVGIDNFRKIKDNGHKIGTYSHSNYIEMMTTTGFIGLFIYYSFYFCLLKQIKSNYRYYKINNEKLTMVVFSSGILYLQLIYDFAMVSYYEKIVWMIMAGVISEQYIVFNKMKKNEKK